MVRANPHSYRSTSWNDQQWSLTLPVDITIDDPRRMVKTLDGARIFLSRLTGNFGTDLRENNTYLFPPDNSK